MANNDDISKIQSTGKRDMSFAAEDTQNEKKPSTNSSECNALDLDLQDKDGRVELSLSSNESSDMGNATANIGASKPKDIIKQTPSLDPQDSCNDYDSKDSFDEKSESPDCLKRKRTISDSSPVQNFIFPGVAASPPKFMSLEEVMKAAKGVSNMVLAHEIAVDKNFKLEKFDPPENSIEKQVRDVMHKAFWDQLSEQLSESPPVYTQAFVLLQEVRDNLTDITLPQHTRLRQEIADHMDLDLIKQQAHHGVLDFRQYSQYVLSIMARLCAPVRDEIIQDLMNESQVVEVFRGVLETLDFMKLDMANFTIQQIRPHIVAQSVEYEKKKFDEFLKTQNDGLELTREWLIKHITSEDLAVEDDMEKRKVITAVINKAYLDFLCWPENTILPETVVLDSSRILELGDRLSQVCILGSVLLVTLSSVGPLIHKPDAFKRKLKRNLCIILDPALSEKETMDLMENLAEQVVKDVEDFLSENGKLPLPVSARTALKLQILEIKNPEQRIRALIRRRALEFIGILMASTNARPVQMPPGLSTLQEELAHICGTLLRLVSHNRSVFGDYYADIILQQIKAHHEMKKSL